MTNNIKLSIIMPVYQNEKIEDYIREIHEKIIERFKELDIGDVEFIIAEDGSRDNTRSILKDIAEKYGLTLNLGEQRRGYIKAAKELYMQAQGDYIFFTDSDHESSPDDFWKLWDKIQKENLDIVLGYKKNRRPYYRLLISLVNSFLMGVLFNVWLREANSGFRMMKRSAAREIIPLTGNLFTAYNSELFIVAKKLKYLYGQVPVKHFPQKSLVFPPKKLPMAVVKAFFELIKLRLKQ